MAAAAVIPAAAEVDRPKAGFWVRTGAYIIDAILIGVIWVAFDAQKQGWHDKIAGTYVVKGARPANSA